jgi:hypothetical protein
MPEFVPLQLAEIVDAGLRLPADLDSSNPEELFRLYVDDTVRFERAAQESNDTTTGGRACISTYPREKCSFIYTSLSRL